MRRKVAPNRLRALRNQIEPPVSQIDLAIKARIERTRYWRIEKGYDAPTGDEVDRLAKALRVDGLALGFAAAEATR